MTERVSSELIRRQASELQRVSVSDERASELAVELESLNSAVFEAALDLEFDDEPAGFARLLRSAGRAGQADD